MDNLFHTQVEYQTETSRLKNLKDLLVSWGMRENKAKVVAIKACFPDVPVSKADFPYFSKED